MLQMEAVLQNIVFYGQTPQLTQRIFVVSAYAGVTDELLENRKTGAPGIYTAFCESRDCKPLLENLRGHLVKLNEQFAPLGLDLYLAKNFIENRIALLTHYLKSLSEVLASGYVPSANLYAAAREMLASVGEAHAAFNMVNMMQHRGAQTSLVDLSGFDDQHPFTIDQRIVHTFKNIDLNTGMAVATGYCKGVEGIMREFDRGYSEVTFSKAAVALNVNQAIIHKEYHLSSADPEIVGVNNCLPVKVLNYNIADQLADIGMQAIHPKASKPLELAGIDLRIKNTFQPEHDGTLFSANAQAQEGKVDLVSGSDKVFIFEIIDPLMVGAVGFDERIMGVLNQFKVSYILKTTSANSISMVVFKKDVSQAFLDTLRAQFMEVRSQDCALIAILGMSLKKTGILAASAGWLAQKNIAILSIGLAYSQVNLQLVVEKDDYQEAIKALHRGFFEADNAPVTYNAFA